MADQQEPFPISTEIASRGISGTASYLTGLVGKGIQGSGSPMMHQSEADAQGMRLIYRLFDLDMVGSGTLEEILKSVELAGFSGVNITYPFKQAVMSFLDELSEEARQVGAVNTVLFRAGRRIGYNTDLLGFSEGFQRGLGNVKVQTVAQIGAGGAGAATATAMLRKGCKDFRITDFDETRAQILASRLSGLFTEAKITVVTNPEQALSGADGMINATPVGMKKYPGTPVPDALLRPDLWVAEIVYFPLETELLRLARSKGCRTVDGSGMAVFQAAAAFDLFTGHSADRERMRSRFTPATL